MNKNTKSVKASKTGVKRPGSGRTKGSNSFVILSLGDLTRKFNDTTQKIQVSRKWAEMQGYENLESPNAKELYHKIDGTTEASKVAVKVEEL